MQVRLLRAIQEREVQRVGSNQTLAVDVRLIIYPSQPCGRGERRALSRDLYKLNVVTIGNTPLRRVTGKYSAAGCVFSQTLYRTQS